MDRESRWKGGEIEGEEREEGQELKDKGGVAHYSGLVVEAVWTSTGGAIGGEHHGEMTRCAAAALQLHTVKTTQPNTLCTSPNISQPSRQLTLIVVCLVTF